MPNEIRSVLVSEYISKQWSLLGNWRIRDVSLLQHFLSVIIFHRSIELVHFWYHIPKCTSEEETSIRSLISEEQVGLVHWWQNGTPAPPVGTVPLQSADIHIPWRAIQCRVIHFVLQPRQSSSNPWWRLYLRYTVQNRYNPHKKSAVIFNLLLFLKGWKRRC
jgi:hypothetical protein